MTDTNTDTAVAFVADTHDDHALVRDQRNVFADHGVQEVVHLGDVCTPETMELYADGDFVLHWITGNGDQRRKEALNEVVEAMGGLQHGWNHRLSFGGQQQTFLCRHGMEHNLSYQVVATDESLDYVMHGHWHNHERTIVGGGAGEVLNPGNDGVYVYYPEYDEFDYIELRE